MTTILIFIAFIVSSVAAILFKKRKAKRAAASAQMSKERADAKENREELIALLERSQKAKVTETPQPKGKGLQVGKRLRGILDKAKGMFRPNREYVLDENGSVKGRVLKSRISKKTRRKARILLRKKTEE